MNFRQEWKALLLITELLLIFSFLPGRQHRRGSRHGLVVQSLTESGIAEHLSEISDATYELLLGYKYRLSGHDILELGYLENLFFLNNSPDIAFLPGLVRRFDR